MQQQDALACKVARSSNNRPLLIRANGAGPSVEIYSKL